MKQFNNISIVAGIAGGFFVYLLGGWDPMLKLLVFMVVLDYLTGWIQAAIEKKLSSKVGAKGIMKKVLVFAMVAVANQIQQFVGDMVPLREVVMTFYICNEGLSLMENTAEYIPIPNTLKTALQQLRTKEDTENE